MKVYLLQGATGEMDDHYKWIVAVYSDKEQAELHKSRIDNHIERTLKLEWYEYAEKREIRKEAVETLDKQFPEVEDSTHYAILEYPLTHHLDQFLEEMDQ